MSAENRAWLETLARGVTAASRRASERIAEIERLVRQCDELARMDYDFLYDPARHLLAIGYNVDERRRDPGYYDLLASEARFASFVAIAQGQLPQENWFALGRLLTTAGGQPVLLSWSGSMFEYLMPLLVMPTYDNTLLDQTCRVTVERQIAYGKQRGVPWGISECGYNSVDASLNYQYRAFGVPGLGLKRGLAEDLVIAPYASALALMVAPEASCHNLQRLAADGLAGRFGLYEAIDYTPARLPRGQASAVVRSFMAHHQGMILLSLAHLLLERPMQKRFEVGPAVQGDAAAAAGAHPEGRSALSAPRRAVRDPRDCRAARRRPCACSRSPDTPIPEVQLLSNGRYHVMVTNAGGGSSRWKDLAVTRWREDSTCDNWGTFCYIRDVASGDFWSTAHQPTATRPTHYEAIFTEARAEFRRRDNDFESHTEIVVSPEDDIELRRLRITNRARTRRTIDVTSYAEVVLASAAADALHPAFSNLFVQTEIIPQRQAILCTRRPRSHDEPAPWMFHLMAVHGPDSLDVSFETDRMAFIGRGRTVAAPQAMLDAGRLSGSQGSVLDPIVAIRHRITLEPQQTATIDMASGMAETRDAALSLVGKYQDRHLADRVFDLAWTHSWVTLRQINATESDAQLYARLASSVIYANASLRARSRRPPAEPARAVRALELRDLRRSADRAAADRRLGKHRSRAPAGAGARVLAPEGTGGGPRDLERGPRRLPAGAPGPDHGADRRRHRSARDGSTGRDLRAAGGADRGRGPHPAPIRGARHHHRPPGEPGGTGHPARPGGGAGPAPRADPEPSRRNAAVRTARARIDPGQRARRIHARRQRVRHHAAPGPGDAGAVGQRAGESGLRHGHFREPGWRTRGARTRTSFVSRPGTTTP